MFRQHVKRHPAGSTVSRTLASLLDGVTPDDPYTFVIAPGVLLAVAGLAALVPAADVLRTDIARALRSE